jgi:TPR repeat protein
MSEQPISHAESAAAPDDDPEAKDPATFARTVRMRALGGSLPAVVSMGHLLLSGHGIARDEAGAFRWFRIAADGGSPDGANMVGRCYELGLGVARDPGEAARWYRQAADRAHDWGMFNLGSLLLAGEGIAADRPAALSLFVRSARKGNVKAMNMLGRFREEGWGVRRSDRAAGYWYERAARGGCFRGQFHAGRFALMRGAHDEAAGWFARSVEGAPPDYCRDAAAILLAHPDEAVRAIGRRAMVRACESGEGRDFHALGRMLAAAPAAADRKAALGWLRRARDAGFDDPEDMLGNLLRDRGFLRGTGIRWRVAALPSRLGAWFSPKRQPRLS